MTPEFFESAMSDLIKTTNRELLHNRGLELIRQALGDNAHNFVPGIDKWLERVKQLGKPVVPIPFKGAGKSGVGRSL